MGASSGFQEEKWAQVRGVCSLQSFKWEHLKQLLFSSEDKYKAEQERTFILQRVYIKRINGNLYKRRRGCIFL